MQPTADATRSNPVFWAMIAIPLATVLAGLVTLRLAFVGGDPELPARYATEGAALDRDFERARRAESLGIGTTLRLDTDGGAVLALRSEAGAAPPATLELLLTHATLPALDRRIVLRRQTPEGDYSAAMAPLPAGDWLVQVDAAQTGWRLRGRLIAPVDRGSPRSLHLGR